MFGASGVVILLATGCKPPVEAPAELGDLGLFLFQHFDDEDPAEMNAGLVEMTAYILSTDLAQDPADSAFTMPTLEGEALDGFAVPDGVEASEQIPVALSAKSPHALDDQLALVFAENQICIESDTTLWAERMFLTDTACFELGIEGCVELKVSQEVYKKNPLASVWYDQYKNYRWYDLTDDEGNAYRAMVGRSWIEEKFIGSGLAGGEASWDQLFQLDVSIENPDDPTSTLRWFSLWSSVHIPGISNDAFAVLVKDGIAQALEFGDAYIAGTDPEEYCPNDVNLEKPTRE